MIQSGVTYVKQLSLTIMSQLDHVVQTSRVYYFAL